MFRKSSIFRGITCVSAFFLGVMIYAANLLEINKIMVDQTLNTKSSIIVSEEVEGDEGFFTTFVPDDDMMAEDGVHIDPYKWDEAHKAAATNLQREGIVLLKNTGNALPLAKGSKITLLGGQANNMKAVFTGDGYYDVNPLSGAYSSARYTAISPSYANNKMPYSPVNDGEKDPALLTDENIASFSEYHDACIIAIGRGNSEGPDYKKGADSVNPASGMRSPLSLTAKEKATIDLACANFNKVIVLIHTVSPVEVGYAAAKENVKAMLYVGTMGTNAEAAIALREILAGETNPSGGLYDTYASCAESSPAMMNMGLYEYTNKDDVGLIQNPAFSGRSANVTTQGVLDLKTQRAQQGGGRIDTSSIGTGGTDFGFYNYLIEAENLYVGYRYYETRYYDCVLNQGNAKSNAGIYDSTGSTWNYTDEMTFTFGYGLSYTTFEFTMGAINWKTDKHEVIAEIPVTVKNTGSKAGKTPVQIYSQAPYTQYDKTNGVEKSAIQLVTFEKTKLLEPGESQVVNVTVDLQDVASYDCNKAKTYIMETSDDYYFAVGNGAHDALNNILAAQGKTTADGMDYNGRAAAAVKWSYVSKGTSDVDDFTFAYSKTNTKITNQLNHCTWEEFESGKVTELTRNDWKGTWPKEYTNMTAPAAMLRDLKGFYFDVKTAANSNVTDADLAKMFDVPSDLKFADFKLAEFDDYRWEELLNHMSLEETIEYAIQSGRGFAAIDSIGVPTGSYSENGAGMAWLNTSSQERQAPWKVAKPSGSWSSSTIGYFATYAIWASSFNRDIMNEIGRLMGNDAILGDKPIVWLPGANTHRTPFGGRASQYFCEDPVLTGICTMELAYSALPKGGIITAKHFAFNDQEGGRSGIAPFMTEQRAREIELRAFQIAFEMNKYDTEDKDVGMLGVMTSFSKIGSVECTASYGLMTNILNKEWGFHGYCVSDLKDDLDIMPQTMLAGSTGYDWRTENVDLAPYRMPEEFKYDMDVLKALKEACHRKLWVFAHTPLVNIINKTTHSEWNMTWWRGAYIAGISVFGVLTAAGAALYVVSLLLKKKGA